MTAQANRLPSRFPVGTKLVIESRPTRSGEPAILSRYVELPNGRSFALPARGARKPPGRIRQRRRSRGK